MSIIELEVMLVILRAINYRPLHFLVRPQRTVSAIVVEQSSRHNRHPLSALPRQLQSPAALSLVVLVDYSLVALVVLVEKVLTEALVKGAALTN